MVRSIHKIKIASIATLAVATPALVLASMAKADNPQNVDFNVNVAEVLTVSITDPASWASGDLSYNSTSGKYESNLLTNKVTVSAVTNNAIGVTVSMYADDTNLINQTNNSNTIATLSGATTSAAFPVNAWGYSTDDGSNYGAMTTSTTPVQVLSTVGTASTSNGTKDVYFGARANNDKLSGTYKQTVYFAAVTGTIDTDNPVVPVNPSQPDPVNNTPTYQPTAGVGTGGQTRYTSRSTAGSGSTATKTTTTEVSKGDTTSSYAPAHGVTTSTSSSIDGTSSLATALGVAAGVAAVSGISFFVLAKRKKDDDED